MCFERQQINRDRYGGPPQTQPHPPRIKVSLRQVDKGGPPKAMFGIEVSGERVIKMAPIQSLLEVIDRVPLVGWGLG